MLGLYVHVPFCSAICNYCNFNRGLFDADLKARYVEALVAEIRNARLKPCATDAGGGVSDAAGIPNARVADAAGAGAAGVTDAAGVPDAAGVAQGFSPASADTIFFGGGTPS